MIFLGAIGDLTTTYSSHSQKMPTLTDFEFTTMKFHSFTNVQIEGQPYFHQYVC